MLIGMLHPTNRSRKRDPAASGLKPAKLLAVFVVETNETELTIPPGTEV
jgi:hypothetical protein